MCNATYVCFECRLTARRPSWRKVTLYCPWLIGQADEKVPCSRCHRPMRFLGPTLTVPPKRDDRGWRLLQARVLRTYTGPRTICVLTPAARRRQAIGARMTMLRKRGRTPGRLALIRRMGEEAARIDGR
jgi:hypothetical protein